MLFKNPFILYFLSLLIVPILVHLFQFRKFKTEYFSNVAFLKTLQIQTRKSSKIKKWLLLFTRLLLLAALIFAFAMPYFPAKDEALKGQELVVVVDNSFSMQAQGKNGELLKKSLVDLIKNVPESQMFTLLTNENTFENISVNGFRNEIQSIDYTAVGWNLETISNRIKNLKKESIDVLLVTDGNSWESLKSIETLQPTFLIPEKEIDFNISIDSVYIQNTTELFYNLGVDIKKFGTTENPISVRILSQNKAIANQTFTAKEAKETLAGLADGSVDVVIGTHRLLSPNIKFKDLGLVVIDEEQRFGVEHKDALKKLKTNVDILAMSATPIPRTLEMAVTGIREMSTLATPPEDRHPILTFVGPYSDKQAAAAIRR
jgi:hypothetical protein